MNKIMKKINILTIISFVCLTIVFSGIGFADITEDIKQEIPESWLGPKTASEVGIEIFNQSPILDEDVESGKLPPVEERLPNDPVVIQPIDRIGDYGGTLSLLSTNDLEYSSGDFAYFSKINLLRPDPLEEDLHPDLIKDIELSEDKTEATVYLQEGRRWSDGELFTTDDFMFWWKAEANNEKLSPSPPSEWGPVGWESLEKIDNYTLKIYFTGPNPFFRSLTGFGNLWQVYGGSHSAGSPAHFLKQFHPDFTDNKEKLNQIIEEEGYEEWFQFYNYITEDPVAVKTKFRAPTLRPYVVDSVSTNAVLFTRNPYAPFVDPEGNQLPYIDNIELRLVEGADIYNAKISTGEADFAASKTKASSLPMYKKFAQNEGYRVIISQLSNASVTNFMINQTVKDDPGLRKIFQDVRFRKALSLGINRNELNEIFYFGLATPSATTVNPTHKYYDPSFQKYIEYNPKKANALLDDMGLVDQNGDGWRDRTNGEALNPILTMHGESGSLDPQLHEKVVSYWQDLGLKVELRLSGGDAWWQDGQANKFEITSWPITSMGYPSIPARPRVFAPVMEGWINPAEFSHWMAWAIWYYSNGTEGEEPPAEIKKLIDWYEEAASTMDGDRRREVCTKLFDAQTDNVYTINTLSSPPKPILVKDNLVNIPDTIYSINSAWGYWMYHPETMFFKGENIGN